MKSIIFASMLVMHVSWMYPMEPEKKFESQITFETCQLLETLPIDVNKTIWKKVIDRFQGTLLNEDTFLLFEPQAIFTPEELALRYPWKLERGLFKNKVHYSNGSQSFQTSSEKLIAIGPNNNNICIVDNKLIKIDDFSKPGFIGFIKGLIDTSEYLPVIPSNIHPNKNKCIVTSPIGLPIGEDEIISTGQSALFLYDLDTLKMIELPEIRIEERPLSSDIAFGADDTLLVLANGILVVYSLNEKRISGILHDTKYISRSEFEADSKRKIEDFYKIKGCINNFHYSFDYPHLILFGIDTQTYGVFNVQNKQVTICEGALPAKGRACLKPRWSISMKDYSSYNFHSPLKHRDAVSLISSDIDNLRAYFLTSAAHSWLNSAEKPKQEARSILSALYHSKHRNILLLKSMYVTRSGRTNPFKVMFHAIKQPEHRHVTEVI